MPRYFAKSEGNFELPTEGSHVASLTTLAFLGQHLNSFSNKYQELVGLAWETDETDSEGRPLIVLPVLKKLGYDPQRAKTNIGLGRITNPDAIEKPQEAVSAR